MDDKEPFLNYHVNESNDTQWPQSEVRSIGALGVSNNSSEPNQPRAALYIVVTATWFYIMIFVVGVLGNLLVVVVICRSPALKTVVNMYLFNLCVADILVLIVCMPTALVEIYSLEAWYFGEFMCKLVPFIENTTANASVLTILAISIERYKVVCGPLQTLNDRSRRLAWPVAGIWLAALVGSVPCLYIAVYRQSHLMDGTPIMVCRNPITLYWQRVYVVSYFCCFFVLPCSLLIVLYLHLCRIMTRSRMRSDQPTDTVARRCSKTDRHRQPNQVVNTLTCIVVIFFVCHLPLRVVGLWFTFEDKEVIYSLGLEKYLNILYSTRILFYLNHALNPILYNFVAVKFRESFRQLFCRTSDRGNGKSTERKKMYTYIFTNKQDTMI